MKKKFVLVIAIVLIAVTTCVLLVGCAPKSPTDFLDKWLSSNSKSMKSGDTVISIYGNVAVSKSKIGNEEFVAYTELDGDTLNMYNGRNQNGKMVWSKSSMTMQEVKEMFHLEEDLKNISDIFKFQMDLNPDEFKDFDKDFTKKDGVFVGNEDGKFKGTTIKLSAKEMVVTVGEGEKAVITTYTIGCDKISIPDEAKNAK